MPAAELAKKFFRPSREIAGRKPLLRCLVSEKRAEPAAAIALLVKRTGAGERRSFSEQDSTTVPKFAYPLILPLRESCWGVPSPNPAMRLAPLTPAALMRQSKGGHTMRKKYNTPHRSHVVKTRLSDEEHADFMERLAAYQISQSEFIRQAIRGATIRPMITVSPVNDELLAAVGKLTAEYGKVGGNLNQIARCLNEYGAPYAALSGEIRGAAADLAALKFEVLQKVGEAIGDTQTYQL